MKKKKTFFDEDITIDEKLFNNFKIDNIVSWSHLELWCAIQNVEVNYEFFKGILCGMSVFQKLFDIVLDAIENTQFVDKFLDDIEVVEIIEKLFIDKPVFRSFKAKEFWVELAYNQKSDDYYTYFNTGTISENEKKYRLLNALFKKCPLLLVKFYDKHKMAVHSTDDKFERWLVRKCEIAAQTLPLFVKICNALYAEIKKQNKLSMYLN